MDQYDSDTMEDDAAIVEAITKAKKALPKYVAKASDSGPLSETTKAALNTTAGSTGIELLAPVKPVKKRASSVPRTTTAEASHPKGTKKSTISEGEGDDSTQAVEEDEEEAAPRPKARKRAHHDYDTDAEPVVRPKARKRSQAPGNDTDEEEPTPRPKARKRKPKSEAVVDPTDMPVDTNLGDDIISLLTPAAPKRVRVPPVPRADKFEMKIVLYTDTGTIQVNNTGNLPATEKIAGAIVSAVRASLDLMVPTME